MKNVKVPAGAARGPGFRSERKRPRYEGRPRRWARGAARINLAAADNAGWRLGPAGCMVRGGWGGATGTRGHADGNGEGKGTNKRRCGAKELRGCYGSCTQQYVCARKSGGEFVRGESRSYIGVVARVGFSGCREDRSQASERCKARGNGIITHTESRRKEERVSRTVGRAAERSQGGEGRYVWGREHAWGTAVRGGARACTLSIGGQRSRVPARSRPRAGKAAEAAVEQIEVSDDAKKARCGEGVRAGVLGRRFGSNDAHA